MDREKIALHPLSSAIVENVDTSGLRRAGEGREETYTVLAKSEYKRYVLKWELITDFLRRNSWLLA